MRTYKRKTQRASTPQDMTQRAVKTVVNHGQSCHAAAKDFGIDQHDPCLVTANSFAATEVSRMTTCTQPLLLLHFTPDMPETI